MISETNMPNRICVRTRQEMILLLTILLLVLGSAATVLAVVGDTTVEHEGKKAVNKLGYALIALGVVVLVLSISLINRQRNCCDLAIGSVSQRTCRSTRSH
jgi:hypothetical protein